MNYDIIGDVHGQSEKLVGLLKKLGYQETKGGVAELEQDGCVCWRPY